jgi:hypothetical protein
MDLHWPAFEYPTKSVNEENEHKSLSLGYRASKRVQILSWSPTYEFVYSRLEFIVDFLTGHLKLKITVEAASSLVG